MDLNAVLEDIKKPTDEDVLISEGSISEFDENKHVETDNMTPEPSFEGLNLGGDLFATLVDVMCVNIVPMVVETMNKGYIVPARKRQQLALTEKQAKNISNAANRVMQKYASNIDSPEIQLLLVVASVFWINYSRSKEMLEPEKAKPQTVKTVEKNEVTEANETESETEKPKKRGRPKKNKDIENE